MIFNIHAGHNPDGKIACGAVGLIKESTEARRVKDEVIRLLKAEGHTIYDCTCENGISQGDVLSRIVKKCNSHKADLDISVHFNSGRNDYEGDISTGGVEIWVYSKSSKAISGAKRICHKVSALGLRNRGVKVSAELYFLKKSAAPAMLIECCFVDDADDVKQYNYKLMAKAIAEGILNKKISTKTTLLEASISSDKKKEFKIKVTSGSLNIRSGPGTDYKITGCIKNNGVYTIAKISGNWGKLKSGAGWINISKQYVKYL